MITYFPENGSRAASPSAEILYNQSGRRRLWLTFSETSGILTGRRSRTPVRGNLVPAEGGWRLWTRRIATQLIGAELLRLPSG